MPIDDATFEKSKREVHSPEELARLAGKNGSLFYELWMMLEAEKLWQRTKHQKDATYNMAIECFLLHFRNLRVFLFPPAEAWTNKYYFDDVIAFDFWNEWRSQNDDWKECSPSEKKRIDKLLAHLSYLRASLDHHWPIHEMSVAMQAAFAEFIKGSPRDCQKWFEAINIQ